MKILYIDATVRSNSRTAMLAEHLLKKLPGDISRVKLCEITFPTADEAFLAKRDKACADKDLGNEMFSHAERFADADIIVIAAPFWDLSFPATLKQYFEQINVIGLTFEYSDDGRPVGLCKAKKLFYVTTAGGKIYNDEYGYGYVRALAEGFYGISEIVCFKAEGLDIYGTDTDSVLSDAKERIDGYFKGFPAM
ncbi:MAG: NAD(P)H-dependent oxidoreductase [Ruminiclostridium sp.]|nr:NAD(P)H-dependent oxidoreductase [Ruminiclostridium sp.]